MSDASDSARGEADDSAREGSEREANANVCPVCGARLLHEKCKLVCRSPMCVYRIIFNCAEF